jgi:hypothetical protein
MGEVSKFFKLPEDFELSLKYILLLFYAFGFSYVFGVYQSFDVQINYYIGLIDLFYHSLFIFLVSAFFYLIIVSFLGIISTLVLDFVEYILKRKVSTQKIEEWVFLPVFALSLLLVDLINKELIHPGEFYWFPLVVPCFILKGYFLLQERFKDTNNYLKAIVLFFSIWMVQIYGKSVANSIKNGEFNKVISFDYNSKFIKTNCEYKYIGETSTHIFIFDSNSNESIIIDKKDVQNLKILVQ